MRNLLIFPLVILTACGGQANKEPLVKSNKKSTAIVESKTKTESSWIGTVNGKVPVFLHYSIHDKIIIGEITYLNTKERHPIKIIGTLQEDASYRLLEFEPNGNITGIITGKLTNEIFTGSWFSPKTRKDFQLALAKKDTLLETLDFQPGKENIYGNYHYQFSEDGYTGDFKINKLDNNRVAFSINAVTGAPAYNIADVPTDTIQMTGDNFIYKIPDSDSCGFKVTFYKEFLSIGYTHGYCDGQFGNNATIDGIFLKIK